MADLKRILFSAVVAGVLVVGVVSVAWPQDTTTLLALFLRDLRAGTLGTLQTLSSVTLTDVTLSRGAANRLDLATGDSFNIVNGTLTVGSLSATRVPFASTGGLLVDNAAFVFTATGGTLSVTAYATGGLPAAATTTHKLVKKVTGIADNSATNVLTVTVPNANHAATIRLTFLSSNGSTDAFESSRTADGAVVLARTSGVTTVVTAATLTLTGIATVAAGATHTLAYGASAVSGAAGATQTFTIQVTIDDSGNLGSNQVVVLAEVVNAEATGVTIS